MVQQAFRDACADGAETDYANSDLLHLFFYLIYGDKYRDILLFTHRIRQHNGLRREKKF
jgi:hypothetical protein